MRLSKTYCALFASFAVAGLLQVPAQTPPSEKPQDAARDDLRKALGSESATPASPAKAEAPSAIVTTPAAPQGSLEQMYPASNLIHTATGVVARLSLEQAVLLALEHNLDVQIQRYFPIIAEYDWRAQYGAYDPILSGGYARGYAKTEGGGFNEATGEAFPASKRETEGANGALTGTLPSGMTYDIAHSVNNVRATTPVLIGTDSFDRPIYISRVRDTWNSGLDFTLNQPLLKNFWIDSPRLQIKLRRLDLRRSHFELERVVMDVINRVEKAYYTLIANRELVRVGETDVAVKKQFFEEQEQRVRVGTLAPLQAKLAQAELSLAEINLVVARKNEVDAETILKGFIQDNYIRQLNLKLDLTDRLLALPAQLEIYDAFKEAVEKRPDLQAERLNLEKQRIQLKFDFNQLFPSLDIYATWGANGLDRRLGNALDDISGRRFPQDVYGFSFSIPLTLQRERMNYNASEARKIQQILILKRLEETIVQDVDFQVRLLRTTWATIPLRRAQTIYQEAALEAEKKMLAEGKSTTFNVLKIASDLTKAQSDEIGTLRDYNQAVSELNFRKGTTLERWHIDSPSTGTR
jgi:outer membrane protein